MGNIWVSVRDYFLLLRSLRYVDGENYNIGGFSMYVDVRYMATTIKRRTVKGPTLFLSSTAFH